MDLDLSTNVSRNISVQGNETTDHAVAYYWVYTYDYFNWFVSLPTYKAYLIMLDNILPVIMVSIVCLSVVGNLLTMAVVLQAKNRNQSISIYIASLALADLIINCGITFPNLLHLKGYLEESYSMLDCKLRGLIPSAGEYVSVWTLTVISIERAISVTFPHRIKSFCNITKAKTIVAMMWIIGLSLASVIAAIAMHMELPSGLKKCTIMPEALTFYQYYFYRFYFIVAFMIPLSIVLTCTSVILYKICKRSEVLSNGENKKKVITSVTKALIMVNIAFILLCGPTLIYYLLDSFDFFEDYVTPYHAVEKMFVRTIFTTLIDLNSAINFLLYFLSGARFRNDLLEFVTWRKRKPRFPLPTASFKLDTSTTASSIKEKK